MSSSWANMITKKTNPIKQSISITEVVETEIINTEKCIYEKNFMDFFGYKTSLLWEQLQSKKKSESLFCKCRSSIKFHEFLFDNLELLPNDVGVSEYDSDDDSETEEFVE